MKTSLNMSKSRSGIIKTIPRSLRQTSARKSRAASEEEESRKSPGLKDSLFYRRTYPKDIRDLLKKKPAATPPTSGERLRLKDRKRLYWRIVGMKCIHLIARHQREV